MSDAEFQPRSILVPGLPSLRGGETISADTAAVRGLFDPRVRGKTKVQERWRPLLSEWASFIHEPELALLGREIEKNGLSGLSGMGPGLTPAGDDYLSGWITAMRTTGQPEARSRIADFLRVWEPEKTTWLSKWMLLDSIRGKIWKRGKKILAALEREDARELIGAASGILSWGHTSGRAWLAGLAGGLSEARR